MKETFCSITLGHTYKELSEYDINMNRQLYFRAESHIGANSRIRQKQYSTFRRQPEVLLVKLFRALDGASTGAYSASWTP